jgi:Ras family protein A
MFYSRSVYTILQGSAMAKMIGAKFYVECCARTGEGVREVFQWATREALRPRKKLPKPSGFQAIKRVFKSAPKSKPAADLEKTPEDISAADALVKLEKLVVDSDGPTSLKTIRLLIIGKTGCGKTTILSKVKPIIRACRSDA